MTTKPTVWRKNLRQNIVREIREELLMSKAELARKAGVSPLTIDRIEKGKSCRMETRRKIILALGYNLTANTQKKSSCWTGYRVSRD